MNFGFLTSLLGAFIIVAPLNAASSGAKSEEAAPVADPAKPTTLDERDPGYEGLVGSKYKPNATYKIRSFKDGTVQSLEAMIKSLKARSEKNLEAISELQEKTHQMPYTEKERLVMSLADTRKKQVDYLNTLQTYSKGIYQTNISLEKMRDELKIIETEVRNLDALLGTYQKENQVAWE